MAQKENEAILLEDGHGLRYDRYDPNDPSTTSLSLRQNAYLDHSLLFSALVQRQFKDRVGRPDRGVKQAGFLVIDYTTMPAVLIELGFSPTTRRRSSCRASRARTYGLAITGRSSSTRPRWKGSTWT